MDVMLDMEFLDLSHSAVVLSIGMVKMDLQNLTLGDRFYTTLDAREQQAKGRTVSADTALWWLQQSEGARRAVLEPPVTSNRDLLSRIDVYLRDVNGVWSNGADMDAPLLLSLFSTYGMIHPYRFKHFRCFRTLRSIVPCMEPAGRVKHHALDDAIWQAEHLLNIYREMRS